MRFFKDVYALSMQYLLKEYLILPSTKKCLCLRLRKNGGTNGMVWTIMKASETDSGERQQNSQVNLT